MKRWPTGVFAATFLLAASAALAGGGVRDPGVQARQRHQQESIFRGVRSGELTRREAQWLESEQRWIRSREDRYRSRGILSEAQRRDLRRDLDTSERNIYIHLHDADRRN